MKLTLIKKEYEDKKIIFKYKILKQERKIEIFILYNDFAYPGINENYCFFVFGNMALNTVSTFDHSYYHEDFKLISKRKFFLNSKIYRCTIARFNHRYLLDIYEPNDTSFR